MGFVVTYFLDVGAYVMSGAATVNLKRVNKKWKVFVLFIKDKYREVALILLCFLAILRATEKQSS